MALAALALTGCVDNDYDLSKDIDMNVQVGGDLTFPTSNTDKYTMAQIMDLDANSSIVPEGDAYGLSAGDYVLVQDGNATNSTVSIPMQVVYDTQCSSTQNVVPVVNSNAVFTITDIENRFHLEDNNIDKSLRTISYANTDIDLNFNIQATSSAIGSGTLTLKPGFCIAFPTGWTAAPGNAEAAAYAKADGNKIVFTADKSLSINNNMTLPIKITGISLKNLAEGQGLYEPGKFRLEDKIITGGPATFTSSAMTAGQSANMVMTLTPVIPSAKILKVTGSVSPEVTIAESSFEISGTPDFLLNTENNLDIVNPQIQLTISNSSPVDFNISGCLTAYDDNNQAHKVYVGKQHGTAAIVVNGNGTSKICLSRTGAGHMDGNVQQIAVPQMAELIECVPNRIVLSDVEVEANDQEYTFNLGCDYNFDVKYKAVVPLAFGKDLKFVYSTEDNGWDEDLDKYSFNEAVITVDIENSIPLDMVPAVEALNTNGNVINDVTADVTGVVKAGTVGNKTNSQLTVTLRSDAQNIGNLDGIKFTFTATCPDQYVGVALNKDQEVRFTNIKVKLIGGVGVDLN